MNLVDERQVRTATWAQVAFVAAGVIAFSYRGNAGPAFSLVTSLILGQIVTIYLLLGQALRERCPATIMLAGAFLSSLLGYNAVPALMGFLGVETPGAGALVAFVSQSLFAGWCVLFTMMEGYCHTRRFTIPQFLVRAGSVFLVSAMAPLLVTVALVKSSTAVALNHTVLVGIAIFFTAATLAFFIYKATHTVTNLALRASLLCSLIDLVLLTLSAPGSFGRFEAQCFGLIACAVVPVVFLIEFNTMYTRIMAEAKSFQKQAIMDPLTGVGNRRGYEALMEMRFGDLRRDLVKNLALLVIDIDDFKTFNDNYGHAAGDRCLVKIATAIQIGAARQGDCAFRYGGEEFCVVLPVGSGDGPGTVADRIRRAVWDLAIPHTKGTHQRVTVSIGIAVAPENGASPEALFASADASLYQAKASGKNCARMRTSIVRQVMA